MGEIATAAEHRRRRQQYMETLGKGAIAVLQSPPEVLRNGDAHFPFRQSSDIFYLTGFAEPQATLVLCPGAEHEFTIFVRPRDPEQETWTGRRAGVEGAVEKFGADKAFPAEELDKRLPKLLSNTTDLYYALGHDAAFDNKLCTMIADLRNGERKGLRPPLRIVDPKFVLHEMRLKKSAAELDLLRVAASITAEAHIKSMQTAKPGCGEHELEALIDYTFRRRGGIGAGYTSIVGAGVNATILHYTENNCPLTDGDLVLIDAGCEFDYYTADVTRTFPVNGRFSATQRRCYEVVLRCQQQAITMTRPGVTIDDIHNHCVEQLTAGMVELGLLHGPVQERIEDESYKRFYMHRTSHWLGMDVHDVGAYSRGSEPRPLEPGMVITIEPGLYIAEDAENVADEYRGIGIRIEDDILVTEQGFENLTAMIPKSVEEVEATCQKPL